MLSNISRLSNHPNMAISYNSKGGIYFIKGEYDKALDYYNKSLVIQIAVESSRYCRIKQ